MSEVKQVTGRGIPLLLDDIDTDRIIPARYLRCVTFDGLGEHVFEDDRRQDAAHPFDDPRFQDARVLVAGRNFGCGSSREHAPQALLRWGIKAIVAESLAEIFFGNCTGLGLPAVCAERDVLERLTSAVKNDPACEITVDVETLLIRLGDDSFPCAMPESAREALVSGRWDFLAQLLEARDDIRSTAEKVPYLTAFAIGASQSE